MAEAIWAMTRIFALPVLVCVSNGKWYGAYIIGLNFMSKKNEKNGWMGELKTLSLSVER